MKKIFYVLLASVALFGTTSCEVDNYEAPNASIEGSFLDSKDGSLVGTDTTNGNEITVYEQGYAAEQAETWYVDNTGTYANKRIFAADYRISFMNTNFYPYTGSDIITVKKGNNKIDFTVTPFLRVVNPTITYDAASKTVTAKFKVEQGKNDPEITLGEVRLFAFGTKWVGNSFCFGGGSSSKMSVNAPVDPTKEYTLTMTVDNNDFKYDKTYYFRIGVKANGPSKYGTIRHNYSPLVKIEK